MTHRYYPSTGGSGSCPWSTSRGRRLEDPGQLLDVTLQVAEEHPFHHAADRHLAERRVRPDPLEVGVGEGPEADHGRVRLARDAIEQRMRRQGAVTPDGLDPVRVGLDPPERHRLREPFEDALHLSDPIG